MSASPSTWPLARTGSGRWGLWEWWTSARPCLSSPPPSLTRTAMAMSVSPLWSRSEINVDTQKFPSVPHCLWVQVLRRGEKVSLLFLSLIFAGPSSGQPGERGGRAGASLQVGGRGTEAGEWTGNALNCALTLSRSLTEVTGMKLLRRPTIKDKKKSLKEWTFQFVEYYKLNLATYFDKASCRICWTLLTLENKDAYLVAKLL